MGTFPWVLACEEMAAADMGMAVSLRPRPRAAAASSALGTDEQKARLLPPMTAGQHLGAFALTEHGHGSDASAMSLLAAPRRGRLPARPARRSGSRTAPTRTSSSSSRPSTAPRGATGSPPSWSSATRPASASAGTSGRWGSATRVSAELVFERRPGAGCRTGSATREKGLKVALSALGAGRISIAAACVGVARAAMEHAARYAAERSQFGRPIGDQEMIQALLAETAAAVDAARLLTWRAARLRDAGQPINSASAWPKLFASDTAMKRRHRRGPGLRRRWLQPRQPGGALHARREGGPDLRGDQPDPPA